MAYFHKMMARGGPAGTGESEPQGSDTHLPIAYVYQPPSTAHSHVTNTYPQLTLAKPQFPVSLFPSLASKIQNHVSILFSIQVVEHYASHQGQFPATVKVPATEVVE